MPHVSANDVRFYFEERGSGTPILGLHGAGSSALFWEDAAEKLSGLGRVITYDRRGSSRSERPEPYEATSVREHAADALALLRALDAEPAVLIGRSYGGTVALDLALRHPESVLGIALLEAGPTGLSPEYDEWFESLAARLEHVIRERGTAAVGERSFSVTSSARGTSCQTYGATSSPRTAPRSSPRSAEGRRSTTQRSGSCRCRPSS